MPRSDKKVVYYKLFDNHMPVLINGRTNVRAFGHPDFHDGQWVHTSRVLSIKKNGTFETLNTIYKLKKD